LDRNAESAFGLLLSSSGKETKASSKEPVSASSAANKKISVRSVPSTSNSDFPWTSETKGAAKMEPTSSMITF